MLNQLAQLTLGLVGLRILTHLVPPDINGFYQVDFLTLTQLAILATHAGIINSASRNWQREQPQAGAYAWFLLRAHGDQTLRLLLLLGIVTAGCYLWSRRLEWLALFPLLLVSNVALALGNTATLILNAGQRHWRLLGFNVLVGVARALLPAGMVWLLGVSQIALCLGFTLHALGLLGAIAGLFLWVWGSRRGDADTVARWRQELRDYGRPFLWIGVGGWLLQFADRWIVALCFDPVQSGLFATAVGLSAAVPNLVLGVFMQRYFPLIFAEADRATSRDDWRRLARRCDRVTLSFLGASLAGLAFLQAIGPWLVGILLDARYAASLGLVLYAGAAMTAVQVNQFYYLLLQGQRNSLAIVQIILVVAALRTAGSVVTATLSWGVFVAWLIPSLFLAWGVGRWLILRRAMQGRHLEGESTPSEISWTSS